MSVGLKFLSAALTAGAGTAIVRLDPELLKDNEVAVYEFCRDHYRQYREVPTAGLVLENLNVRMPRTDAPVTFYEDELQDRFNYEICRSHFQELRTLVQDTRPAPMIELMERTARRIRRTRRGQGMINIGEAFEQVIERLERNQGSGGMSGIPTPWPTFNLITSGYQPADLITWVARTGVGKTMTLLAQAEEAYDLGYSVLFVTTEMNSEQICRRWIAMKWGFDPDALKTAQVSTYTLRKMRSMNLELLGRERFRLLPAGMNSGLDVVEAAIEEMQPDILFLDGVYLMRPTNKQQIRSKTEIVSAVFDELKQRNIDTNIPFVVNTQFNRQAGKAGREGGLESIGLSDTIGQHSSIVVAVKPGPTDNWHDSRELDFLKGREGEQGKVIINYLFKPTNLSEMSDEELERVGNGAPAIGNDGEMYT